jgi:hypothetical protein
VKGRIEPILFVFWDFWLAARRGPQDKRELKYQHVRRK